MDRQKAGNTESVAEAIKEAKAWEEEQDEQPLCVLVSKQSPCPFPE